MRPQHGLGAAQVRVAGNHGVGILLRQIEQRGHQRRAAARATRSHSSRSHRRVSSDTCSLRLRPVWILSATFAGALLQFADDQRVDSSSVAPSIEPGWRGFARIASKAVTICSRSSAVRCRHAPGARECLRAADIGIDQPLVEMRASRRSARRLPTVRFRTSAPEFHDSGCQYEPTSHRRFRAPRSISSSAFWACSRFSA